MTYDAILLSPDNLNGSEEEIIDLQKKKMAKHTFQGWSWTQSKLIR